ncbi:MAG: hypothetical protein ACREMK_12895 [Gemmatimonadota bacterium]
MRPVVELVYESGCPHVEGAREVLARALSEAGLPPEWIEWDASDPEAPERCVGLGSPTILVDGRDRAGGPGPAGRSCRLYRDEYGALSGVPSRKAVLGALLAAQRERSVVSRLRVR